MWKFDLKKNRGSADYYFKMTLLKWLHTNTKHGKKHYQSFLRKDDFKIFVKEDVVPAGIRM